MGNTYSNVGPVNSAHSMRDLTNNNYHYNIKTDYLALPPWPPAKISLKPICEPHGSFIGRVAVINSSIKYLTDPVVADAQIQFPCLVIHALGGYGKTQTARKIASVCKKKGEFQHFIWIDSENDMSVKKDFVAVMEQIGFDSSVDSPNFDSFVHQLYDFLVDRINEKFLIIFDNVEKFDEILPYLPLNYRASNIAVLMTSQRSFTQHSYGNVKNQRLDVMTETEAIELVEHILGTSQMYSERDKKLLVKRSGRIALVLCVMASTIKFERKYKQTKSDYSIEDYLTEMSDQPICYSDKTKALDLNYEKSLQAIVRFTVAKLNGVGRPIEQIAVKIFDYAVYCSPNNYLIQVFVKKYLRNICEEAKNVDMELPMGRTNDQQIIQMAIEKLSEISLVQSYKNVRAVARPQNMSKKNEKNAAPPAPHLDTAPNVFTIHDWIKVSRRIDLKNSGDERNILWQLLSIVADSNKWDDSNSIIWQRASDYSDLVNEWYVANRTLRKFPLSNVDVLEKIIVTLTQSADFKPFGNYFHEIDDMIGDLIGCPKVAAIERIVNAFNYDVSKKSTELISSAILSGKWSFVKWLIEEKSCIPVEDHFRHFFNCDGIAGINPYYLAMLKEVSTQITEEDSGETLERIKRIEITRMMSHLVDSDPLKIALCKIIKKNCGESLLQILLHCACENVESKMERHTSECFESFQVLRRMLSALRKLPPSTELDGLMERYSEMSLLECRVICGQTHCSLWSPQSEHFHLNYMEQSEWNDMHRAACDNDMSAMLNSIDPALTESKDIHGRTPLMLAVYQSRCEATTILLEKYAANVNVMDAYDRTPLMYAIANCHPSMAKILLNHGAKTDWKTASAVSVHALHQAVEFYVNDCGHGADEIVEAILASKDCNVNTTDVRGNNILHLLVENYYATRYKPRHNALQLILPANAALANMRNNDGVTPAQLATNLMAKFTDDHWHVNALQSFISELERGCDCKNI